jgi:acid phosphatase
LKPAITWHGPAKAHPSKVLVVVEENHAQGSALAEMPYLASLARTHGHTTAYRAITHPSLPNYLALAGGSTFGVTDDADPSSHRLAGPSAFDRVIAAGKTAKTYADAMPSPCGATSVDRYAVRHNPWVYFADRNSRANCERSDVPAGTTAAGPLQADIHAGALPNVGLVIPDVCNDAHDCSLGTADSWLKTWLPVVMAGPDYKAGRLVIVVTFDEDDRSGDNTVLTTVISPYTSHVISAVHYTHYSLTRYFAELTGTTPLRASVNAPSLRRAFHI